MKRLSTAAFVILFATGAALAQDKKESDKKDADKIGKDKAVVALKKALAEVQKKKGAAIAESAEVRTGGPQQLPPSKFEGVLRKDFAAAKGAAEMYARGSTYLVNLGGRFDPPDQLQGQEGQAAQSFKNPSLLLDELNKNGSPPQYGPDEMVDGKDCKVVDVAADPALLKQHLKEFGDRLNIVFKGLAGFGGTQVFDLRNAMDEKASAATYHVCIGKDDLLVYRIDYVLRPKMKPNALPGPLKLPADMDQKVDVLFSKWDEDVPFEIPGVIKTKWGIK
jgi:hypothetical protein